MKYNSAVAKQLERYGSTVTIAPRGGKPLQCRAMIRPMSLRRMPDSDEIGVTGGDHDQCGMIYIGPADCRLDRMPMGTTVTDIDGTAYRVINARCMMAGDVPVYVWAVLQEAVKEAE